MKHQVQVFMSEVRDLALPRLKEEEQRLRGWEVPMVFEFRTLENRLHNMLQYGQMGMEMGVSEMSSTPDHKPILLTVHRDDTALLPGVYGEVIAFTLIHELAHVATGKGHDAVWAEACQTMGICEHPYDGDAKCQPSLTSPFKDQDFLRQIKRLGSYPGDEPSDEEKQMVMRQMAVMKERIHFLVALESFRL